MQNLGTIDGGMTGGRSFHTPTAVLMSDAQISSGGAFLSSELEKRDVLVRQPLTSFTYARDIPVKVGGGWVETVSALHIGYGVSGGSADGMVAAGGANGIPVVQANLDKEIYKSHIFAAAMRVMFADLQRTSLMGRSLDRMLTDGVRLSYDKHMDANVYMGLPTYGTTGLLNNKDAVAANVAAVGGKTAWKEKTPDQILMDVNAALTATWAAAEYDPAAVPNHILLPYEQYLHVMNTKVSEFASETILDFILKNNVASKNGSDLFIGSTNWCRGAGVGGTNRMAVYVNNERFVAVEELAPLRRVMTQPNAANVCYDSAYMANLSEVEVFYPQTVRYYDGI